MGELDSRNVRNRLMRFRTYLTPALGISVALSVILGCGTAPASRPTENVNVPTSPKLEQPTAVTTQLQPGSKAIETGAITPKAALTKESEPQPQMVKVGYKVGMQAPEFRMTLFDGTKVSSVSLADQGKPTFLYFHATW